MVLAIWHLSPLDTVYRAEYSVYKINVLSGEYGAQDDEEGYGMIHGVIHYSPKAHMADLTIVM